MLDVLSTLVNYSLLQADLTSDTPRFTMLETVREYAWEQLRANSETEAAARAHAAYFQAFAERAAPELLGPAQVMWLARVEYEHPNLQTALEWALSHEGDPEIGLALAGALWRFWSIRGYFREGRAWLERAVEMARCAGLDRACSDALESQQARCVAYANALHGAGALAADQNDYSRAAELYHECLEMRRALGDIRGTAHIVNNLGRIASFQGDYAQAIARYEESLALKRTLNDLDGVASTLNNLGLVYVQLGDFTRADSCLRRKPRTGAFPGE